MESLGLYLLKSAVWLTGFTLVFLTVLRNERYFRLNRLYLIMGIVASIVFPFYTWHYAVILPSVQVAYTTTPGFSAVAMVAPPTEIPLYWWFYLVGMAGIALRLIWQTAMVVRKLRKTGYVKTGSVKLVRTSEYDASFSFFSYVFVNPSTTDIETKEIVNHEREHIQQRHWFDLLLVELLCMFQWFNPFVWIYARLIRQNHEYLADEMALQHTSNPALYQATLLNQMLGAPVISLANSFNYSLNKKRFKMMKKKIDSPFRKLKMLLVLPLVAMVFYAFAKPEYIIPSNAFPTDNVTANVDGNDVKGKVVNPDGKPLPGTTVILSGTTIGTIADVEGNFKLVNVPNDGKLTFSFVGFKTVTQKPDFNQSMTVKLVTDTVKFERGVVAVGYGPKPTVKTDPGSNPDGIINSSNNPPPLFIVDGKIIDKSKFDKINTEDFESMEVFKDKSATDKYGEKGKYGVVL
ncbi:MAG TPA: carboxypeptidase-like regulatory domain-containing protein, partial [Prolixibacteraceae bacterium]